MSVLPVLAGVSVGYLIAGVLVPAVLLFLWRMAVVLAAWRLAKRNNDVNGFARAVEATNPRWWRRKD